MRPLLITSLLLTTHFGTAYGAKVLTLPDFIQRVQTHSPDLAIEKSLANEADARAKGVRISPPMIGLMRMNDAGGTNSGFEISQELPFPTKIHREKEVRENEAKSQYALFNYRKNAILLDARAAYLEFWQAFAKANIALEKRDWLKSHVKISRTLARGDSNAQIHLLGTESEADLLENEVLEAQAELTEKTNALRNFVPDLTIQEIEPQEPKLESIEVDPKSQSGLVILKESEVKLVNSLKGLRQQAYLPDLVFRYRSYSGNEMTQRNEEVMVGITLPFLFFWQPQSEVSEISARGQRAQAELEKSRVDFETRVAGLLAKSESLKKQLMTLKVKLIPRAEKRMRLVENLSARSIEGLDTHRMVMLDYLDLRTKELNARNEFEKALIEISRLIGKEAPP